MNIELKYIFPKPLKERLLHRVSDVWSKNLLFQRGERIKILAPSGTGKSTFIHSLYRLRTDYEGDILWDSTIIKDLSAEHLSVFRQTKLSIVFQDLRLFEHMTAFDNIDLARVMQHPICSKKRIDELAKALNIEHILHQQTGLCSYGEQQRIAIARSLVKPFDWLLMDEPFSHLDMGNRKKAIQLIDEECRKRKAGFIITDLHQDDNFSYSYQLNL